MSYQVFARKYRPQTFDDVIGQEHITQTLKNAIEQDRLAHAYIFIGPRGTGKTSTARILAKALNCVNGPTVTPCGVCDPCREIAAGISMDVLEFDAASNTQVDKIRDIIIDNVKFAPTRGKYKLYIVDEVHMLSTNSFNALLKTLEEPPAHVKFVFATTNVEKVPTTILSRCQRFDLKRIPAPLIARHLLEIAGKERIQLTPEAADTVARGAEGGMRDAESMLDQLVAFCGETIDEAEVLKIFGFTARETVATLCDHLFAGAAADALGLVHEQAEAGKDLSRLIGDLIDHLRNLLVVKADPKCLETEFGAAGVAALAAQSEPVPMGKLLELIEQFAGAESRMKWAPNKKMHVEIAVLRGIQTLAQASLTDVLETLTALREGKEPPAAPKVEGRAAKPAAKVMSKAEDREPKPATVTTKAQGRESEAPPAAKPSTMREEPPWAPLEPAPVAPVAAPQPPEAAPPSPLAPRPSTSLWPDLIAEVRTARPLIGIWVEALTLLQVEGDTAVIGYPPEASLAAESCQTPSNRKFLEEIVGRLAGRALALRFVQREGLAVAAPAPRVEVKPEAPRDPMEEFKNDPLIRRALELFKAEIQPA